LNRDVYHKPVSDETIEDNARRLGVLNCDEYTDEFPNRCEASRREYRMSDYDSSHFTAIGVEIKGQKGVQTGWISIPADTLDPNCVVTIKSGQQPSHSSEASVKRDSGCGKKEEKDVKVSNVSPTISVEVICDGKEMTSFRHPITLQFVANVKRGVDTEKRSCVGYFSEGSDEKSWKCLNGIDVTRVTKTQVLYTTSTDHFTR